MKPSLIYRSVVERGLSLAFPILFQAAFLYSVQRSLALKWKIFQNSDRYFNRNATETLNAVPVVTGDHFKKNAPNLKCFSLFNANLFVCLFVFGVTTPSES